MCQGLLPSRRHSEKREDPGDEVDCSYQLSNDFQQREWFGRFEKVSILPNFKGIFFYVVDKLYG